MNLSTEMIQLAQDYVAQRVDLSAVADWANDHLPELAELPDDDAGGAVWGFVQGRIWDMEHGFTEEELRVELAEYLRTHDATERAPGRATA